MITQQELQQALRYCHDTGVFVWARSKKGLAAGAVAGTINRVSGYRYIGINGRSYCAHRLAWLYVHGEMPPDEIDHINGFRDDNRIANLRPCTHAQNHFNRHRCKGRSGVMGVRFEARGGGKWVAQICARGARRHLGTFDTIEAAAAAYRAAKSERDAELKAVA